MTPALREELLDLQVRAHISSPEPIDGLLWVTHDEQLTGNRSDVAPTTRPAIAGRQKEQDLRLKRIRVLELVHEDMRKAFLKISAHLFVVPDHVAGANEQV